MGSGTGPQGHGLFREHYAVDQVKDPVVAVASFNSGFIDVSDFNMVDWLVAIGAIDAATTVDVKVRDADTLAGAGAADLAASTQKTGVGVVAPAQITIADVNSVIEFSTDLRKARNFVEIEATIAGGGPSVAIAIEAIKNAALEALPQ